MSRDLYTSVKVESNCALRLCLYSCVCVCEYILFFLFFLFNNYYHYSSSSFSTSSSSYIINKYIDILFRPIYIDMYSIYIRIYRSIYKGISIYIIHPHLFRYIWIRLRVLLVLLTIIHLLRLRLLLRPLL
jgi:hypothetical protein